MGMGRDVRPPARKRSSSIATASGEPALGPVAFMHRPSAMDMPTAPIGHHWQDATHISFGVITAGLFTHDVRIGSIGVQRARARPGRLRIRHHRIQFVFLVRISYNPGAHWALNAGYGFIKSPEALTPDVSMHRVTASAMYGKKLGDDGQIATTFLWGANARSDQTGLSHSGLIEAEAVLDRRNIVFGRIEVVQKRADDLLLDVPQFNFAPAQTFNVGAASLGYIREVLPMKAATIGVGAMGTVNVVPQQLQAAYGSR